MWQSKRKSVLGEKIDVQAGPIPSVADVKVSYLAMRLIDSNSSYLLHSPFVDVLLVALSTIDAGLLHQWALHVDLSAR